MLVLCRSHGQQIRIDLRQQGIGFIDITIAEIRPHQVKVGFDALPEVQIHRMEIWEAIERATDEPTELEAGNA